MNEEKDVIEIDLWKLIGFYLKKWWVLLTAGGAAALCALLISTFLITPMYSSDITVYVNNARSSSEIEYISGSSLAASQQLVNTYINILKSTSVLDQVIREGELEYTAAQLQRMITAHQVEKTELFKVTVTHEDPRTAAAVADAIGRVAPGMIAELVDGSSAKVIDRSGLPRVPSSPSVSRNTVLGGLLGVLLAGVALTLRYLFDFRLKDEEDLMQYFDIPVLGSIPSYKQAGRSSHGGCGSQSSQGRNAR